MVDIASELACPRAPGGRPMRRSVHTEPRPAPRVRHEPPTIEEAIAAARGMTADRDQQVEIAAGLIGVSADQVRLSMSAKPLAAKARSPRARTAFVVERKSLTRPAEARSRPAR